MNKSASIFPPKRNDPRVVPPKSATNFLPFLSGGEEKRQAVAQIPPDGIWFVAAGICRAYPATENSAPQKHKGKIPLA